MKRLIYLMIALTMFISCVNAKTKKQTEKSKSNAVEVLYFHGKQRCITCRSIEALTKEVLEKDFKKEMNNKKIVFKVIDITENEALADKYEVSWSSLILDKKGKIINLTDMGFSYAKNQPDVFKAKLKDELSKILK
ncbi:MAG: thioredoxin [Bacteroidia bacterium]|nr:thioredoxin [Bacteroidia bacterium]